MKAVIVDLDGNNAVALRDDGRFEKIKNKNYSIGQELNMQSQMIRFPKQAAIAASAAIVIAACGGMGTYTWCNPVSYVSLDINPSIAYSLNAFNRVIAVSGMNDEGTAIVDAIGDSLKNTDITTALTITVEQLSTDAYLDAENANYMVIGVYSDKDSKANALMSTVDEFTANSVDICSVTTVNISKESKESADSYGITGGKMELINEIANVAVDPKEVDPAALADLTVAELEQTKNVAASGASITEAVASAMPGEKKTEEPVEPKQTQTQTPDHSQVQTAESTPKHTPEQTPAQTPEPASESPVVSNTAPSESKPTDSVTSTSSTKKDEPSEEKPSDENSSSDGTAPVVTPASAGSNGTESGTTTGNDTNSTSNEESNSNSNSASNSGPKNESGSSDKKDETSASPSKGETTSSEKKDEADSSDKKDNSSSDKKDSSSSDKKEEVYEDTSQQTHSGPIIDIPEEPTVEFPDHDNELIVCSMAI